MQRADFYSSGGFKYVAEAVFVCFALIFTNLTSLYGQVTETGTIVGTVTDPGGAVVPEAGVTLTNLATGIVHSTQTNSAGIYQFSSLPGGTYEIRVAKTGFSTVRVPHVVLNVGVHATVDVTLKVGAVTQTVEVRAEAALLEKETNTVSQVVTNQAVVEMPLNGRDYQQLQLLTPGVVPGNSVSGPTASGVANYVNGMRVVATNYLIDGADVNDVFRGPEFVPPIDAIAEFTQVSSNAPAEGGFGPSVVSVAIKSGTNGLHGTAFEFVRNNVFDARNFFSPTTDVLKRNQFGAAVGGPIKKDKAFFFFTYEGTRQVAGGVVDSTVPLNPWRTGDFSAALGGPVGTDALGRTILANQVFDPLTSRTVTAGQVDSATGLTAVGNGIVRDPFLNNMIPAARINPASSFLQNQYIPTPLQAGTSDNYVTFPSRVTNPNTYLAKVDVQVTPKDRLFFTGGWVTNLSTSAPPIYTPSQQGLLNQLTPSRNGVIGWTRTLSPTTLLNVRLSDSWAWGEFTGPTVVAPTAVDVVPQLGIDPVNGGLLHAFTPGIPTVSIPGFTGTNGLSHQPTGWKFNTILWSPNLSALRGKHSFQFGYALRDWKGGFHATGDERGNWNFDGRFSDSNSSGTFVGSVQRYADFLQGYPQLATRVAPFGWFNYHYRSHWAYFQDSYKITPKLTLNYGLRYEFNPWPTETRYQESGWVPDGRGGRGAIVISDLKYVTGAAANFHVPTAAWMQVLGASGANLIETAAQAGLPKNLRAASKKDFAPRIGFAWNARGSTVIRGGYGYYFIPDDLNHNLPDTTTGPPFVDRSNPLFNTYPIPTYNMQNSYCRSTLAAFPGQCVAGGSFSFPAVTTTPAAQRNQNFGYVQQWNLSIQRTFATDWLAEAGYIGSGGHKQEGRYDINVATPGLAPIQSRRAYPDFGDIFLNASWGNSSYNALQLKVQRQFAKGLSVLSTFTWSKSIDDNSDAYGGIWNPYNYKLNKGVSTYDVPLRFTTAYVWQPQIPQHHGPVKYLINGWEFTGIIAWQSGFPYTPVWSGDPMNTGYGTGPDRVCNGKLSNPTPQQWFDASCFVAPSVLPGTGGLVHNPGNSGRDILRLDRLYTWDMGGIKDFNLSERFRLQFRAEAFNLFNTVSFGAPGGFSYSGWGAAVSTAVNVPNATVVHSAAAPRVIQLGLKLYF